MCLLCFSCNKISIGKDQQQQDVLALNDIKLAAVTANNHYAGFGLETANIFRNMLGLPEAKWEDKGKEHEQETSPQHDLDLKQSTLSDFLN